MGALLGTTRGLLGNGLARLSGSSQIKKEASYAVTVALLLGLAVMALSAMIQVAMGEFNPLILLLSASIVFVLPQDVMRWSAIADQKFWSCLVSDLLWALASLAMLFVPSIRNSAPACAGVWLAGAAAALLWLILREKVSPQFRGFRDWWMHGRSTRLYFGLEGIVSSWTGFISLGIATLTVGTTGAAALRGGGILLGPLALVLSAIPMLGIPEMARSGQVRNGRQAWQRLRVVAWTLGTVSLLVGFMVFIVPARGGAIAGRDLGRHEADRMDRCYRVRWSWLSSYQRGRYEGAWNGA